MLRAGCRSLLTVLSASSFLTPSPPPLHVHTGIISSQWTTREDLLKYKSDHAISQLRTLQWLLSSHTGQATFLQRAVSSRRSALLPSFLLVDSLLRSLFCSPLFPGTSGGVRHREGTPSTLAKWPCVLATCAGFLGRGSFCRWVRGTCRLWWVGMGPCADSQPTCPEQGFRFC